MSSVTETLQWRSDDAAQQHGPLWSLLQEDFFGDFWAEQLPELQTRGWLLVVRPGFAHESVAVDAWHLIISPDTGELLGKEVAARMRGRAAAVTALGLAAREGSWLLTLGIEIDGQMLDLVPLRAQLLAQRVRPFILRRRKDQVAGELPPRTEIIKRLKLQGRGSATCMKACGWRPTNRCAACCSAKGLPAHRSPSWMPC